MFRTIYTIDENAKKWWGSATAKTVRHIVTNLDSECFLGSYAMQQAIKMVLSQKVFEIRNFKYI